MPSVTFVEPRVAVLIACRNAATTIGPLVDAFRRILPRAAVHVHDCASTDGSAEIAMRAGAIVRQEKQIERGIVLRRMLADVDADIVLIVGDDGGHDVTSALALIERVREGPHDLVNAVRMPAGAVSGSMVQRRGERAIASLLRWAYGNRLRDVASDYKAMTRRFVKSWPGDRSGRDVELDLMLHALQIGAAIDEVETVYNPRQTANDAAPVPSGGRARVLRLAGRLIRDERPLSVLSAVAVLLLGIAALLVVFGPDLLPGAGLTRAGLASMLAAPTLLAAGGLVVAGVSLGAIARARKEARRLHFLSHETPS